MAETDHGSGLLSRYPADKIIVECRKCPMRAKFDKLEMIEAGGDRMLTHLLDAIVKRKGCDKMESVDIYNRCGAYYANLLPKGNAYAKAKGG